MRSVQSPGSNDDGAVLRRELSGTDARLMHALRSPAIPEIDHLVVGPGGVTVITSGRGRDAEVTRIARQRLAVRLALAGARPELRNVGVVACLCLPNDADRPLEFLSDDVLLGGAVAAAQVGARDGDLDEVDIAEIARVIAKQLAGVTRGQIDGRGASAWQLPPGSRRLTRRLSIIVAAAILIAVIGVELPLLLNARVSAAAPSLRVIHARGRVVAAIRMPPGSDRVGLQVKTATTVHYWQLLSIRRNVRWTIPRSWTTASHFTVAACVLDSEGLCISPVASAPARGTGATATP